MKKLLSLFIITLSLHSSLNAMMAVAAPDQQNEEWRNRKNVRQDWDYFACNHFSVQHEGLFIENNPAFFLLRTMNRNNMIETYNRLLMLPIELRQNVFLDILKLKGDWFKNEQIDIGGYFQLILQHQNIRIEDLGQNGIPTLAQWYALFYPPAPAN